MKNLFSAIILFLVSLSCFAAGYQPIANTVPQYVDSNGDPYSGAVLKAYIAGTSTNLSLATDSGGGTTFASIALNSAGYPELSGNVVIPHADQDYKLALYPDQTAADADSGAIWTVDNISLDALAWVKGTDVASASALAIDITGNEFDVTGTTTITSMNSKGVGTVVILHFDGILTLTHHSTDLVLPNGRDITTQAGDIGMFYEYASGDWRAISFTRQVFDLGADIASASALAVDISGDQFDVTGTTTITSINAKRVGSYIVLQFDGALTLTHHSTDLILPGAANITTAAGDIAVFWEYATGDWRCVSYSRADGTALSDTDVVLGTEQATTSGTTIDFTSIPSGTKKISILFEGVSTNGTSDWLVQIGDSGGIETGSYVSSVETNGTITTNASGFIVNRGTGAATTYDGVVELYLKDSTGFTWNSKGMIGDVSGGGEHRTSLGVKSLTTEGTLDRVRITTVSADTFDAGSINIQYQ